MHKAKDYHGILALIDGMNLDRIKDRRVLEMVADAYNKSGLYKEAREALLIAYERFARSRSVAYKLAIISVKLGNLDDAVDFYEDFCHLAPNDNNRYILKYIIGRAGGIEAKDLIRVLEQYNERESDERWLYELAKLYHEAGRADECVALCDEIALWYADGDYEKAALELKFMHKALSPSQQTRYEQIMSEFVDEPAQAEQEKKAAEEVRLEEEAEIFLSEFSGERVKEDPSEELFEEARGKDPSVETFQVPVDKVNEILEQSKNEPAPSDPENITFRLPTDLINEIIEEEKVNKPKSFSEVISEAMEESLPESVPQPIESAPSPEGDFAPDETIIFTVKPEEKAAAEPEPEEVSEPVQKELQAKEPEPLRASEPVKKEALAPAKQKKQTLDVGASAAGKLGTGTLKRSSKAYLIKKPSLTKKEIGGIGEPTLRENVDTSDIPIANESDGQIGINLVLIDKNDRETIQGQLTIDEFFDQYAGKVARSRDTVAAVEAERLRQIVESVKDMEPTPLYDMSFNSLENEDFKEEELIAAEEDIITIVSEEETEKYELAADAKEAEIAAAAAKAIAAAAVAGIAAAEADAAKTETAASAAENEVTEEYGEEIASAEEIITAEETDAEDIAADIAALADTDIAAPAVQKDADIPEEVKVPELDAGFAAALESFKQSMAGQEEEDPSEEIPADEEDDLLGFEDDLADFITGQPAADDEPVVSQSTPDEDGIDKAIESVAAAFLKESMEEFAPETESEPVNEEVSDETEPEEQGEEEPEEKSDSEMKEEARAEEVNEPGRFSEDVAAASAGTKEDAEFKISDEFRSEIKEFLLIDGIEDEIKAACAAIAKRKQAGDLTGGNLIITGDKKSGKTYLAIAVIKAVIKAVGIGSGKVVKVQAQPLNGKNISAVLQKVDGRDLIIENVGYLKDETIQDLINVIKNGEFKQMIVLEGNMLAIENITMHFPEIKDLFGARIDIHELTITQWANIAKKYAKDQGYTIDAMADLALHARIDKINVPTARLGLGDIKDIVDSAIAKASKRNNGKLFAAFTKKGKEDIALTESDFLE